MSIVRWSFAEFIRWLRCESVLLKDEGFLVELQVSDATRPSARLRAEKKLLVGELTVWDDGATHVAVVDLRSGEFIFERDGLSLASIAPEEGLKPFFVCLRGGDHT
jgi:hypothetical protein